MHQELVDRLFNCREDEVYDVLAEEASQINASGKETLRGYLFENLPTYVRSSHRSDHSSADHEDPSEYASHIRDLVKRARYISQLLIAFSEDFPSPFEALSWAIEALHRVRDLCIQDGAPQIHAQVASKLGEAYGRRARFNEQAPRDDLRQASSYLEDAVRIWGDMFSPYATVVQSEQQRPSLIWTSRSRPTAALQQPDDNEKRNFAQAYSNLGNVHSDLGYHTSATRDYRRSIELLDEIDDATAHEEARLHVNLADVYQRKGQQSSDFEHAIEHLEEALEIYSPDQDLGAWVWARNMMGIALAQRVEGPRSDNIEQAIQIFEETLDICEKRKEVRKADAPEAEISPFLEADIRSNLGNAYAMRIEGERAVNLEKALECFKESLRVFTYRKTPADWIDAQINLGVTYKDRIEGEREKNLEAAIQCFQDALDRMGDSSQFPESWAHAQNNLGIAYTERILGDISQNYHLALECFDQACKQWDDLGDTYWHAQALDNLGNTYTDYFIHCGDKEALTKAREHSNSALEKLNPERTPYAWANVQANLGEAYAATNNDTSDHEQAAHHFHQALSIYKPYVHPRKALTVTRQLGDLYQRTGQWSQARKAFDKAIDATELLRDKALRPDRRKEIVEDAYNAYVGIVEACIATENNQEALSYAEQSRGRVLADLLHQRSISPSKHIPSSLVEEEQTLRREIRVLHQQIQQSTKETTTESRTAPDQPKESYAMLREQIGTDPTSISLPGQSAKKLRQLTMQWHNLLEEIATYDATYRQALSAPKMSFNRIAQLSQRHDAGLIEWYETDNRLHAFVVSPGASEPSVVTVAGTSKKRLGALVKDYQDGYRDGWSNHASGNGLETALPGLLHELSETLSLDKVIAHLPESCRSVILVPHRALHLFPLHALPIQEQSTGEQSTGEQSKAVLADRFDEGLWYAPSVLLAELADEKGDGRFDSFWAVENPTADLPLAEVEVADIQHHFGQATVLSRNKARRSEIEKRQIGESNCVHFACHGAFDSDNPLRSRLRLAEAEDLTLGDVFELSLPSCRLAVLSACESGLTDIKDLTDEYVGLPSGFLFAGSKAVLSSLWMVPDVSTALLMMYFYDEVATNEANPDDTALLLPNALQRAQHWLRSATRTDLVQWIKNRNHLSLRKRKELIRRIPPKRICKGRSPFSDPYYWSSFKIVGR